MSIEILASLLTLTILEIVLGIDNLVFVYIAASRLPVSQQKITRRLGLFFAMFTRLLLLALVDLMAHLSHPLFSLFNHSYSFRDLIFLCGGLFLLYKGTREIHANLEPKDSELDKVSIKMTKSFSVIAQIAILDIVFSLDSVITAVGMAKYYWIMASAIVIAIVVMMFGCDVISKFIEKHLSVKMLAFSFILLVGVALIADGLGMHIPRGYLYFAISFSLFVETINILARKKILVN